MNTYIAFPEMLAETEKPLVMGKRDDQRNTLPTPSYAYGWILPRLKIHDFIVKTLGPEECEGRYSMERAFLNERWTSMGFKSKFASPPLDRPQSLSIGNYLIMILIASNDTVKAIDAAHGNKDYIKACRACLGNLDDMQVEPVWFRAGLKGCPKGYTQYNLEAYY